jgi:hypothetical protein
MANENELIAFLIESNERLKGFAKELMKIQQNVLAEVDKIQLQIDQLSGGRKAPPL